MQLVALRLQNREKIMKGGHFLKNKFSNDATWSPLFMVWGCVAIFATFVLVSVSGSGKKKIVLE